VSLVDAVLFFLLHEIFTPFHIGVIFYFIPGDFDVQFEVEAYPSATGFLVIFGGAANP
jgi:hypothetical protein